MSDAADAALSAAARLGLRVTSPAAAAGPAGPCSWCSSLTRRPPQTLSTPRAPCPPRPGPHIHALTCRSAYGCSPLRWRLTCLSPSCESRGVRLSDSAGLCPSLARPALSMRRPPGLHPVQLTAQLPTSSCSEVEGVPIVPADESSARREFP